jgi:hypothetical protein
MKYVLAIMISGLAISGLFLTGCDAVGIIKNNVDMCTLINCAQLGIVDIAGPHNPLVPSEPNYSLDPTCTLPGMCGPSIYYPYSVATSSAKGK